MNNQVKLIEQVLNEILSKKNIIYEAPSLMAPVPIPSNLKNNYDQKRSYETHPGIDIPANVGTSVSAIADGSVEVANMNHNSQCGGTIDIKYDDGFWSRFCHMSKIDVSPGQKVKQGQVVGLSGGKVHDPGAGNSQGPHLHFTLKKNGIKVDPMKYINKTNAPIQGDISKTSTSSFSVEQPQKSYIDDLSSTPSGERVYVPSEFGKFIGDKLSTDYSVKKESVNESNVYSNFGKKTSSQFGKKIIPKDHNSKIKSPVNGVVVKGKFNPNCKNQLEIEHTVDEKNHILEYCGIDNVKVKMGAKISQGDVLGITNTDVVVSLFDEAGNRVYIDTYMNKTNNPKKKENDYDKPKSFKSSAGEKYFDSPLAGGIGKLLGSPFDMFKDQYDSSGKLVQKRWGWPGEKVDPWIAQKFPGYNKKVNEEIQKIKKML